MKFTLQQRLLLMIIAVTYLALTVWANTPNSIALEQFTSKRTTALALHDTRFFEAPATPAISIEAVGLPRTFLLQHSFGGKIQGWQITNYWALLQNILFAIAVQVSLYYLATLIVQPRLIHIFLITFGVAALTVAVQRMAALPIGAAAYYVVMTVLITPIVLAILLSITREVRNRQNQAFDRSRAS